MLPESIRAEIDSKGGLAGAPEPQGNGTTIYRAASGDYVVVDDASGRPRMRGFSPPAVPAEQQAPSHAPAPAGAPGAGGMNQQQLEELLKQIAPNGDPRRLVFSEGVRKRQTPADAFGAGGEVQTKWVKWVDPGTGRILEADIEPDRSYTVTKNAIESSAQGAAATSATNNTTKPRQSRVNPADPTKTQEFDPDAASGAGAWVDSGVNAAGVQSAADRATAQAEKDKPKPEKAPDGSYGYWDTKSTPPKWVPIASGPQATRTPVEINGQWGVWEPDTGGVPVFKPVSTPQAGIGLKNVDPFTPDPTIQPDMGFSAWANAQRKKIGGDPAAGGITQKDYDSAVTAAHAQTSVAIQNITSGQSVRRQAEQDERSQRQTLSDQSAADYGRAEGVFNDLLAYTRPGSKNIMSVIPAIMAEQARFRQEREGTARAPLPLHPMFQQMPAAAGVAGFTPNTPAPPSGPMPPNTIGFGAQGNQPAPGLPPTGVAAAGPVPVVAPPAVAAPALAAPMPAPAPVVPAVDLTRFNGEPGGNVIQQSTPGELGQPGDPGYMPPAVVMPGGPAGGGNVQMAPGEGPVSAWAQPLLAPQSAATGQPGMMADLAAQAQRPQFDPMGVAGRMANMGIPQEAIAQAMMELGFLPGGQQGAA